MKQLYSLISPVHVVGYMLFVWGQLWQLLYMSDKKYTNFPKWKHKIFQIRWLKQDFIYFKKASCIFKCHVDLIKILLKQLRKYALLNRNEVLACSKKSGWHLVQGILEIIEKYSLKYFLSIVWSICIDTIHVWLIGFILMFDLDKCSI